MAGTVPPTWGQDGAFPALQFLNLELCQLTGTLPASWPAALQFLDVSTNNFRGTLPTELGSLKQLQQLTLDDNAFTSSLPSEWGSPDAFPELFAMQCVYTDLAGTLPDSWGSAKAFQKLQSLLVRYSNISGTLPESWASAGAFPELIQLSIAQAGITGTLPASWTLQHAMPQLQILDLASTQLHGSVPCFNNAKLSAVLLDSCYFNSTLDAVWSSTAPLQMLSLALNSVTGSLPANSDSLSQLTYLDVSQNKLHGTVPLDWLQADQLLSHMSVMSVGAVWDGSQAQTDWRQQLCLKKAFYDIDVTGQRAALLPALERQLAGFADYFDTANVYSRGYSSWLQSRNAVELKTLNTLVQGTVNQLTSVRDICANSSSDRVLLVVWLVFAACVLGVLLVYVLARFLRHRNTKMFTHWMRFPRLWALLSALYETFYGLVGLTFYYYDLVTSIIVLVQVWGTWPGGILAAIFFFHFAVTGVLVAFRLICQLVKRKYDMSQATISLYAIVAALSMICGPVMIPVVLILDTCAFVRQVLVCCQRLAKLVQLRWVRPGVLLAVGIHRRLLEYHYFGLGWIDLENYEGMHNLVAALLQSLPTVVLNSILFSLGNKPSHGIYFSNGLYVTAIVASCLAMLRCIVVILWQSIRRKGGPLKQIGRVAIGSALAGQDARSTTDVSRVDKLVQLYHISGSAPLGSAGGPSSSQLATL